MGSFTNKINESEESIEVVHPIESTEALQRTEEWFENRRGRFTGSKTTELMSCSRSAAKMEWGRPEKLIQLGDAAKKYIFTKAKERQKGVQVKTSATAAMRYGTENEDVVKELLGMEVEEVDFIEYIPNIAGASPDGRVKWLKSYAGLEIKCATDWNNFYERVENEVCQDHKDFWQLQAEMLALQVDKILYVVAEPSESIFEPNIVGFQKVIVNASPIHQQAIKQRAMLGDAIIKEFLTGTPFNESIEKICSNYDIN